MDPKNGYVFTERSLANAKAHATYNASMLPEEVLPSHGNGIIVREERRAGAWNFHNAETGASSMDYYEIVGETAPRRYAAMDSSDGELVSDYPQSLDQAREDAGGCYDKVVEIVTYEVNSDGSRGAELPAIAA
ncbi:hypothetical protein [Parvularcula lutaonensis]|nr:hypothetical protein [Parvularcula lutaonensis]